jgi:hypothetical protein
MQTTRYRNRFNPDLTVEAVELTESNVDEVLAWAPGNKIVYPDRPPTGVYLVTGGQLNHAAWGDYVARAHGAHEFWVFQPAVFHAGFQPAEDATR